ncbi:hypothetical protein E4V01_03515 [Methylorubrum sp. Q1]|nr:hypothetical protein E4V01_03515 [Methylorubrum sp. Q1]
MALIHRASRRWSVLPGVAARPQSEKRRRQSTSSFGKIRSGTVIIQLPAFSVRSPLPGHDRPGDAVWPMGRTSTARAALAYVARAVPAHVATAKSVS